MSESMPYDLLEQRYKLMCETSRHQLAMIEHLRESIAMRDQEIDGMMDALETLSNHCARVCQSRARSNVQRQLQDKKEPVGVPVSAPATSITIGADGRHE